MQPIGRGNDISAAQFDSRSERFQPFLVGGKIVHQVGIPWHYGYAGLATGASANMLTPNVGDANTVIPEFKAFLCDVQKKGTA